MNEAEQGLALLKTPVKDIRERCPTCEMLAPQHRKWCVTAVAEGKQTIETRQIEGVQSIPVIESQK